MAEPIDLKDRLFEDFEPAPLPPIAPDGGLTFPPPPVRLRVLPPLLCEQGPCVHFHEIQTIAESAEAIGTLAEDGKVVPGYAPPTRKARQTLRTCYPSPGIEIAINDIPVLACNLWDPGSDTQIAPVPRARWELLANRTNYVGTPRGRAYLDALKAYEDDQNQIDPNPPTPATEGDK